MYGGRMGFSSAVSLQDLDGSKLVQGAGGCQDNVYLRPPSPCGPTMVAMRTRAILLASALLLLPSAFAQNVPAIAPPTAQESKPTFSMTAGFEQQGGHDARNGEGGGKSHADTGRRQQDALADHHGAQFGVARAEGDADSQFAGALRDGVRDYTIDSDNAEQ